MSVVLVLTLVALGSITIHFRREVAERNIRWKLYALRDKLLELAYHDRSLLEQEIFQEIDRNISYHCGRLEDVSLWSLLPVFTSDHAGRAEVEKRQQIRQDALVQLNNEDVTDILEQSAKLMVQHLLLRHLFLTTIVGVTVVGGFMIYFVARWTSERIVSGALIPVKPAGSSGLAAA